MTTRLITAQPTDLVGEVARKITERHVSGVFVVDGDRLLGQISHRDVLQHIFPSPQEFYEDLTRNTDFEQIQTRAREVAYLTAADIMTTDVPRMGPDVHVMKVASWMLLKDVHRVAVVDELDRLIGVVSRGDIFYQTIDREMSRSASDQPQVAARPSATAHSTTPATPA